MKCESCNSATINGVFCHERGCPDSWKYRVNDCFECGCFFVLEHKDQKFCSDCEQDLFL